MFIKNIFFKIKSQKIKKHFIWAILGLATYLRFTGIMRRDFWYDEAFTGVAVKENFSDMIQMIIKDVHPPMYYIFLKIFSSFFEYSVFGIRLFSAVFGVLAVWAVYLVAKELFTKKAALWASFVAAVSPFAIQYSQEARMYAMLVFLILISAYFFIRGLKTEKKPYFVWWGIFIGLSMLVHYMGLIFAVTYLSVFAVWKFFQNNFKQEKNLKKRFLLFMRKTFPSKYIFLGYGVAFITFLPWLKNFINHFLLKGNNLGWVKPASFGDMIVVLQMFLFGTPLGEMSSGMPQPNELRNIAHISIRMTLAVLLGAAIIWLFRKEQREKIYLLLIFSFGFMFIVYLLSVFLVDQQYFVARYLLPAAYFIFIFIGLAFSYLKFSSATLILVFYFFLISLTIPLTNSQGYNKMILHMDKYKNNNFYILNTFDYVITKYYLGADRLTLYNYDWPQYNPADPKSYWAAIGNGLKRTEDYEDLRNDPKALIISNKVLNRDNQYFSTEGLELVDQYNNILIYKFEK